MASISSLTLRLNSVSSVDKYPSKALGYPNFFSPSENLTVIYESILSTIIPVPKILWLTFISIKSIKAPPLILICGICTS